MLTRSYVKMPLSFVIVGNIAVTTRKSLRITSLKRKRKERRFVDLRIILILHCGNKFLKQVLNFCFKLDDIDPNYGSITKSFFLRKVGITFSEHNVGFKKIMNSYIQFWMDCYSFLIFFLNCQLPHEIKRSQSKLKVAK